MSSFHQLTIAAFLSPLTHFFVRDVIPRAIARLPPRPACRLSCAAAAAANSVCGRKRGPCVRARVSEQGAPRKAKETLLGTPETPSNEGSESQDGEAPLFWPNNHWSLPRSFRYFTPLRVVGHARKNGRRVEAVSHRFVQVTRKIKRARLSGHSVPNSTASLRSGSISTLLTPDFESCEQPEVAGAKDRGKPESPLLILAAPSPDASVPTPAPRPTPHDHEESSNRRAAIHTRKASGHLYVFLGTQEAAYETWSVPEEAARTSRTRDSQWTWLHPGTPTNRLSNLIWGAEKVRRV